MHDGTSKSMLIAALLALGALQPTRAAVTTVTATPASRSVPIARATSVAVVWNVTRVITGASGGTTVFSSGGTFRAGSTDGPILGTNARGLSQTKPPAPLTVLSFRESVLVPAQVVFRAHELGAGRLFYLRTFDDGTAAAGGAVELKITGGAGGSFGVERLALTFEGGSVIDVVEPGADLRAEARLTFSGSGLLRAVWEVAEPGDAVENAAFRPLAIVRRYVAGRRSPSLKSPALPVHLGGMYRVRLRLVAPTPGFTPPELRYFVRAAAPFRPAVMAPLGPRAGTTLDKSTRFAWSPVPGTRAYRLQILEPTDSTRAVTGAIVDAERRELVLSEITRAHLAPGERYVWRVQAIDASGRVIAESPPRELVVAPEGSAPRPAADGRR
ncbi:MAG: hypothetical protein Q9Q40_09510 [Acidobacteriota bacterium]|nr:hypothetical protein [Acidobacteriota bacterium]MDQ7087050.1 hypothetical protein [Acidobacteriota bacterium]